MKSVRVLVALLVAMAIGLIAGLLLRPTSTSSPPEMGGARSDRPNDVEIGAKQPATPVARPERAPPPPPIGSPAKEPAKPETPPLYFVGKTTECRLFRKRCTELGRTIRMHGDGALEKWLPKQPGFLVVVSCENGKTDLPPGYSHLVSDEDLASPRLKESSGVLRKQVDPTSVVYIVFGRSREALWKEIESFSFDE